MKTIFFTFAPLLICAIHVSAQISITQDDLPAANDTLRFSIALAQEEYDFSTTGENYNWDFSDLQFQTQGLDEYYTVSSVNFLMGFIFPGSIAQKMSGQFPIDDIDLPVEDFYVVYNKNNARYMVEGFFFIASGFPIHLEYTSNDYVYNLPLQYQDTDSTAFAGEQSLGDTVNLTRSGYRINEVDGWGNIITPYGEFECIRVKTILYEYDSLFVASLPEPMVLERKTLEYKWLAKNEKIPVMQASFLMLEDGDQMPLDVRYRDIYREPEEIQAPVASFHADKTNISAGDTVSFFNSSTPLHEINTYQWKFNPATAAYHQDTDSISIEPVVAFPEAGEYSVTLIAENTAGMDSLVRENYILVEAEEPSDIGDVAGAEGKVMVYLNDKGTLLHIKELTFEGFLYIYDITGRMALQQELAGYSNHSVNTSVLSAGSYIIQIVNETNTHPPVKVKIVKP